MTTVQAGDRLGGILSALSARARCLCGSLRIFF